MSDSVEHLEGAVIQEIQIIDSLTGQELLTTTQDGHDGQPVYVINYRSQEDIQEIQCMVDHGMQLVYAEPQQKQHVHSYSTSFQSIPKTQVISHSSAQPLHEIQPVCIITDTSQVLEGGNTQSVFANKNDPGLLQITQIGPQNILQELVSDDGVVTKLAAVSSGNLQNDDDVCFYKIEIIQEGDNEGIISLCN